MSIENYWGDKEQYDYPALVAELNSLLKLQAIITGMKRFATVEEMESIPKIRRPNPAEKLNTDQIVGQSRWLGYTIGVTVENLMGSQCSAVVGLSPRDEEFLSGNAFNGMWYSSLEDSAEHQRQMSCASYGNYTSLAVSPIVSGRLGNPDICLIYATPGQMILFINGLQWSGYKKLSFTCVGESACADSWGNALKTGEPSLSIPCYAERKFGGVQDNEMLMALPPSFLPAAVNGLKALAKNGMRYPIPNHGIDVSPMTTFMKIYG
ncbi:MAG: DUF169 domain-containing protein [Cellvibrionales bacterium]|nr:DUF169 domain-containing protein [Cellvibrionales bacterium]